MLYKHCIVSIVFNGRPYTEKKCVIKILSLNYCFYKTSTYEDEEKKNQAKILVSDNLIDIIEPFVSVDNLLFKGL